MTTEIILNLYCRQCTAMMMLHTRSVDREVSVVNERELYECPECGYFVILTIELR